VFPEKNNMQGLGDLAAEVALLKVEKTFIPPGSLQTHPGEHFFYFTRYPALEKGCLLQQMALGDDKMNHKLVA
jgi:hypothetical protein